MGGGRGIRKVGGQGMGQGTAAREFSAAGCQGSASFPSISFIM